MEDAPIMKRIRINGELRSTLTEDTYLHMDNGEPALVYADGTAMWMQNNQYHREDGPAWIMAKGIERWFIRGEDVTDRVSDLFNKRQLKKDWRNWSQKDLAKFKMLVF